MRMHSIDPLVDRRWDAFVARHPQASVFHHRGWLEALHRTYGYEPVVLTTTPADQALTNGMALCRVSSWMTGTRLVSLPFADHCQPLVDWAELPTFTAWLKAECDRQKWGYVELRPLTAAMPAAVGVERCASFWFHQLSLDADLDQIFGRLHKNSFRRKIRRANREALAYESGSSQSLVDEFYRLMLKTRRRHHMLPQPHAWFRNLVDCMKENVRIRVVRKDGTAIAAMLSLHHGSSAVYKYGCSDARFHALGGMPFLFWKLIEESKAARAETIDLGRCDHGQTGLTIFKDRLGATKTFLNYYRHTNPKTASMSAIFRLLGTWDKIFSFPDTVLSTAGKVVYKHLG